MTGKQKLALALEHKPGPVPIDFGATATSGIHVSVVAALRQHYGLTNKPVKVIETMQMLGEIDDELCAAMGVDVRPFWGSHDMFGHSLSTEREWKTPWGQTVLMSGDFVVDDRGDGYLRIFPGGDRSAAASGMMPKQGGYFFDQIVRQQPFDEENPDPADNLEEFAHIADSELEHYKALAARYKGCDCALVGSFGGTALGDIALVPAPGLKKPRGIRSIEEWYVSTLLRPDFMHKVFDAQTKLAIENLSRVHAAIGDAVDVTFVCGTDLGTQNGPFCSAQQFTDLYLPYYKRVNNWIHQNTRWKTFKHCCGSVMPLIGKFVEAGFDILNPVQWTAREMDMAELKARFGDSITFWGGGVNTQRTLPFGTPQEVYNEAIAACETFAKNGGFVFNAIHNVQAQTPVENVVALVNAVRAFNGEK